MVDEAGAVEQDVDRADLARERLDRLVRADVELALVGRRGLRGAATSRSVAMTRAPSLAKASAVPRPMPAAAAVSNATLPANLPAIGPLLPGCSSRRPAPAAEFLGDISARS